MGQTVQLYYSSTSEFPISTFTTFPPRYSQNLLGGIGSGSLSSRVTFCLKVMRSPQSWHWNSQQKILPENHLLSLNTNICLASTESPLFGKLDPLLMESPTFDKVILNSCNLLLSAVCSVRTTFSEYSSKAEGVLPKKSCAVGLRYVLFALQVRLAKVLLLTRMTLNKCHTSSMLIHIAVSSGFITQVMYYIAPDISWSILQMLEYLIVVSQSSRLRAKLRGSSNFAKELELTLKRWSSSGISLRYWIMFQSSKQKVQARLLSISNAIRQGCVNMRVQLTTKGSMFLMTNTGLSCCLLYNRTVSISSHCLMRKVQEGKLPLPRLKWMLCGAKYPQGQVAMLRLSTLGHSSWRRSQILTSLRQGMTRQRYELQSQI